MHRNNRSKSARHPAVVPAWTIFELLDFVGVHVPEGFTAPTECPGTEFHTMGTYVDDCLVIHDRKTNQVRIECNHNECAFELAEANRRLANLLKVYRPIAGPNGSLPLFDF